MTVKIVKSFDLPNIFLKLFKNKALYSNFKKCTSGIREVVKNYKIFNRPPFGQEQMLFGCNKPTPNHLDHNATKTKRSFIKYMRTKFIQVKSVLAGNN